MPPHRRLQLRGAATSTPRTRCPAPPRGAASAPGSSGRASAMSGAMAARAATPDRGDGGRVSGDRTVDSAGEHEGLLGGAAGPGGGWPNPYAAAGAYGGRAGAARDTRRPARARRGRRAALRRGRARGAYTRAPTADDADADALEPYRDVHPAMQRRTPRWRRPPPRARDPVPGRGIPALRERPTAYDPQGVWPCLRMIRRDCGPAGRGRCRRGYMCRF